MQRWSFIFSPVVKLPGYCFCVGGGHCCLLVVVKSFSCCFSPGGGHCCLLVVVKYFSYYFSGGGGHWYSLAVKFFSNCYSWVVEMLTWYFTVVRTNRYMTFAVIATLG